MGRRATKVPRAPVHTQPRDPLLTGYLQLPQPSISRPLQRSKDIQTHLPQLPLARTPMNGERLHGLLCHMHSHEVTKAQTLWEVETAANTIQTVVLYLDGLHQTTSRLRGILCYPTSGNDVWSSLRLRELRKLLEAQGAMRASRAYRE